VSPPARSAAAIILAAGEARRFGTQKLLAPLGGRPLVQHVIDVANASPLAEVVLVVGADADVLLTRVRPGRARSRPACARSVTSTPRSCSSATCPA